VVGLVLLVICRALIGFLDPPPTVRLLTPKASPTTAKPSRKSKGCAFLEFSHRNALQQALKFHQSELDGRMINVELTAGGGGRSENRLTKVRQRNKALLGQRVCVPLGATCDSDDILIFQSESPHRETKPRYCESDRYTSKVLNHLRN
jgi:RNA recognition motif-containing protein